MGLVLGGLAHVPVGLEAPSPDPVSRDVVLEAPRVMPLDAWTLWGCYWQHGIGWGYTIFDASFADSMGVYD